MNNKPFFLAWPLTQWIKNNIKIIAVTTQFLSLFILRWIVSDCSAQTVKKHSSTQTVIADTDWCPWLLPNRSILNLKMFLDILLVAMVNLYLSYCSTAFFKLSLITECPTEKVSQFTMLMLFYNINVYFNKQKCIFWTLQKVSIIKLFFPKQCFCFLNVFVYLFRAALY